MLEAGIPQRKDFMTFINGLSRRPCRRLQAVGSALVLAWAGTALAGGPTPTSQPPFVDLIDHPAPEANWDRFFALEDHLAMAFHAACAQGGCAARAWFLWPMQLRCSVRVADARVAACVWVIAGSNLRVRAGGRIEPDVVVWRCVLPLPVDEGIDVEAFHAALSVQAPLQVRLPGARASLQQHVHDCLARPGSRS